MAWLRNMLLSSVVVLGILLFPLVGGANAPTGTEGENAGVPIRPQPEAQKGGMTPLLSQGEWAHTRSDLPPDPQAVFGRLPNGFRLVLLPNAKPKDRTSLHLIIRTGSMHEKNEERGLAHFLEHMLFNGSTHFAPGELVKYFQKIGMQFGPDANARTGFYETVYDINLPTSDRQSLQEALLVMHDYAQGALLLTSEIERERGIILAEKRQRDSADYRAYVASLNFELAGTRFPDRLPIGTEDVIKTADRSVFKEFYDAWYRPDNMILVMVGDFDVELARQLVEGQFAKMAARAPARSLPAVGEVSHAGLKSFYHYEAELGSTSVALQVLEHKPRPRDDAHYQQQLIEEQLASQIIRNRLKRKINQSGSPITDASAGSGIFLRQVRYGYISADCPPAQWQAALLLIESTLRQALEFGFNDNELQRVKNDYLAGLEQAVSQADTRNSSHLARELIHSISNDRVFRSPAQRQTFAKPVIENVTAARLHERLRDIWETDHRLILVSGNALIVSQAETPEEQILAVFNQSRQVAVRPPVDQSGVTFPYLPVPLHSGTIAAEDEHADIGVSMVRFENGVRLNFKTTDFSRDEVQFVLSFGKGRKGLTPDQAALAAVVDDVVNESGLGRFNADEMAHALAGKKTEVQFSLREDRFTFSGRSTPEEIELLFQLIYAHIRDPAFRSQAWELAYNRYRQTYLSMRQSVDGVLNLYGWRFLSGDDHRFGKPTMDALTGVSLADMEKWVGTALETGELELSVVGDIERERVVQLAARYLGSLPNRKRHNPEQHPQPGPVFPVARQMEVPVPSKIEKALLVMAFPTDDIWDIQRTRRLNILAEIVSERLRIRIREKLGAAYSVGAYSIPSRTYPGYGLFLIHVPLAPQSLDRVRSEIQSIIWELRQGGVSLDELQRALEPTLTGIRDRFRENGYWLNTVLAGASWHPEQLEWSRSILSDYASITKEDIEFMIERYLDISLRAILKAQSAERP